MRLLRVCDNTYATYIRVGRLWHYMGTFALDCDPSELQGRINGEG